MPTATATLRPSAPTTPAATPTLEANRAERRLTELNGALKQSQTTGTLGNAVANAFTGGALGSARDAVQGAVSKVNELHARLLAKDGGQLSERSAQLLNSAIDFALQNLRDVSEIRDGVVQTTNTVATAAVLTVAAVPSGGASLAALATIGAGTKAGLGAAMNGAAYQGEQAAADLATGALAGALAGVRLPATGGAAAAAPAVPNVTKTALDQVRRLIDNPMSRGATGAELAELKQTMAMLQQRQAAGVLVPEEKRLGRLLLNHLRLLGQL